MMLQWSEVLLFFAYICDCICEVQVNLPGCLFFCSAVYRHSAYHKDIFVIIIIILFVYFLCSKHFRCVVTLLFFVVNTSPLRYLCLSSVLWHCWLGIRKSAQPVKIEWWAVVVVICLEWGAGLFAYGPANAIASPNPIVSCLILTQSGFPFWYWLTQVVLEKRPLNRSNSSSSKICMLCICL